MITASRQLAILICETTQMIGIIIAALHVVFDCVVFQPLQLFVLWQNGDNHFFANSK